VNLQMTTDMFSEFFQYFNEKKCKMKQDMFW
jgi:hypothetical protein